MKSEEKRAPGLGWPPEARLFEQAQGGYQENLNQLMGKHQHLVLYAVKRQNLNDIPNEMVSSFHLRGYPILNKNIKE